MNTAGVSGVKPAQKRKRRAGLGDPGFERHGSVEDADRVDFVAEIFEGLEGIPRILSASSKVTAVDGPEHFLGEVGADTDATGGEAVDFEIW